MGQGGAVRRRGGPGRGQPGPAVGPRVGRGRAGQRAAAARGRGRLPAAVVTAAALDGGAGPAHLHRLGAGPRPGGRLHVGGRHRDPDPAGVDGTVSPPVGIGVRGGRHRRRRDHHLAHARGGPGRGDRPPGGLLGVAGGPDLGRGARPAGADPALAAAQRAAAGPAARADRPRRPGPYRRRTAGQRRPADLHGRPAAAERRIPDTPRRCPGQDRGVGGRAGSDGPDAPGRHLRAGAAARGTRPAAGDHGHVRAAVPRT